LEKQRLELGGRDLVSLVLNELLDAVDDTVCEMDASRIRTY